MPILGKFSCFWRRGLLYKVSKGFVAKDTLGICVRGYLCWWVCGGFLHVMLGYRET